MQFRLQQVVSAPSDKRENLLKELENFAFRGIPNISSPLLANLAEKQEDECDAVGVGVGVDDLPVKQDDERSLVSYFTFFALFAFYTRFVWLLEKVEQYPLINLFPPLRRFRLWNLIGSWQIIFAWKGLSWKNHLLNSTTYPLSLRICINQERIKAKWDGYLR